MSNRTEQASAVNRSWLFSMRIMTPSVGGIGVLVATTPPGIARLDNAVDIDLAASEIGDDHDHRTNER
jgi:hypothetical protein